jgi:hypothetical protein
MFRPGVQLEEGDACCRTGVACWRDAEGVRGLSFSAHFRNGNKIGNPTHHRSQGCRVSSTTPSRANTRMQPLGPICPGGRRALHHKPSGFPHQRWAGIPSGIDAPETRAGGRGRGNTWVESLLVTRKQALRPGCARLDGRPRLLRRAQRA